MPTTMANRCACCIIIGDQETSMREFLRTITSRRIMAPRTTITITTRNIMPLTMALLMPIASKPAAWSTTSAGTSTYSRMTAMEI
jgi:biotin synthase-like enzyme